MTETFIASCNWEGIMDMRMMRVMFGVTSSPFLATQVLRQVAKEYGTQYTRAAKIITNNFYVDDSLTGAATSEVAREIWEELTSVLHLACMWLCKWRSKGAKLIESIPANMHEVECHQTISPPAECHKTLRLHWDTNYISLLLNLLWRTNLLNKRLHLMSPGHLISWDGLLLAQNS